MKRLLDLFRAFWAFLDRNPAIERQQRIAAELHEYPTESTEGVPRAKK